MNYDELSLSQVAGLIPCAKITLHKRIKAAPHTVPRFTIRNRIYYFNVDDVHGWLAMRDAARKEARKPFLRWVAVLDYDVNQQGRAVA